MVYLETEDFSKLWQPFALANIVFSKKQNGKDLKMLPSASYNLYLPSNLLKGNSIRYKRVNCFYVGNVDHSILGRPGTQ